MNPLLVTLEANINKALVNKTLVLNDASLNAPGDDSCDDILESLYTALNLNAGSITLTDVTVKPNDTLLVEGTGQGALLGMNDPAIKCIFSVVEVKDNDKEKDVIELVMVMTTPADWNLTQTFPELYNTYMSNVEFAGAPVFVFSSQSNGTYHDQTLSEGLNFIGELQLPPNSFEAAILNFVKSVPNPVPICGHLTLTAGGGYDFEPCTAIDHTPPIIADKSFTLTTPATTVDFNSNAFGLSAVNKPADLYLSHSFFVGSQVTIGSHDTLDVRLQLPTGITGWRFDLRTQKSFAATDALAFMQTATGFDCEPYIPAAALTAIKSTSLELDDLTIEMAEGFMRFQDKRFQEVSLALTCQKEGRKPWVIIEGVIVLDNLGLAFCGQPGGDSSATLTATLTLGNDIELYVTVDISKTVSAISCLSFCQYTLPDLSAFDQLLSSGNPLKNLLPESLFANTPQFTLNSFGFNCDLTTPALESFRISLSSSQAWPIVANHIVLDSLSLDFDVQNPFQDSREASGIVRGQLKLQTISLNAWVSKYPGGDWVLSISSDSIALPSLGELTSFCGDIDFATLLPEGLSNNTFTLVLPEIQVDVSQGTMEKLSFSLTSSDDWALPELTSFSLSDIQLAVDLTWGAELVKVIQLAGTIPALDMAVSASYLSDQGWQFTGKTGPTFSFKLGDFVKTYLEKIFSSCGNYTAIVAEYTAVAIDGISLDYQTRTGDFSVDLTLSKDSTNIVISFSSEQGDKTIAVEVGDFKILASDVGLNKLFVASYVPVKGEGSVDLTKILQEHLPFVTGIPDFKLEVSEIFLVYKKDQSGGAAKFLAYLHTNESFTLAQLPVVGRHIPDAQDAAVHLQRVAYLKNITSRDLEDIESYVTGAGELIPQNGLQLSACVALGEIQLVWHVPSRQNSSQQTETSSSPPGINWLKIQKSLGPLYVNKLGLRFALEDEPRIAFVFDGALQSSVVSIFLEGLSVSSSLNGFDPSFHLDGLGIAIQQPPLKIAGSLVKQEVNGIAEYNGDVTMAFKQVNLSALASFAQEPDGEPSLFIYGFVGAPIGGPAFFFVDGLALGFGINRKLKVPDVKQLPAFPLVSIACQNINALPGKKMPSDPAEMGADLGKYIVPASGEYFLATGVRFTSFDLINSFALLVTSFGQELQLDILGESTLLLPPSGSKGNTHAGEVLAEIQLAYEAVLNPEDGILMVNGNLTPASWVLAPACRLSGGFAYGAWFKGDHAGNFVYTLGGYGSKFNKPSYYPSVSPIAMTWRVDGNILIKASGYFALTPNAMMAGGHLSATYHAGGSHFSVTASFNVGVDFLMVWKPFYYEGDAHASFSVTGSVHLLFHASVNLDLSANMHFYGPSFSGNARISIHVLFTFHVSVSWGEGHVDITPLLWSEFTTSFLPPADKVCHITIAKGLEKTHSKPGDSPPVVVVNPKELELRVQSAIPVSKAVVTGLPAISGNSNIGINAMGITSKDFNTSLTITIDGPAGNEAFRLKGITKNMPAGLWKSAAKSGAVSPVDLKDNPLVEDVLCGVELEAPVPQQPDETLPVPEINLEFDYYLNNTEIIWSKIFSGNIEDNVPKPEIVNYVKTNPPDASLLQALGFDANAVDLTELTEAGFLFSPSYRV